MSHVPPVSTPMLLPMTREYSSFSDFGPLFSVWEYSGQISKLFTRTEARIVDSTVRHRHQEDCVSLLMAYDYIQANSHRHTGREQWGHQSPPILAFLNFRAIIKIRTDAVCCIHVSMALSNQSINQSINMSFYSHQVPDLKIFWLTCTEFNSDLTEGAYYSALHTLKLVGEADCRSPPKSPTSPKGLDTCPFSGKTASASQKY